MKKFLLDKLAHALRKPQVKVAAYQSLVYGGKPRFSYTDRPYPGSDPETKNQESPIFVTGRFRSGSTLFWQIFRNIDGYTAYYEPFNERRWFDPKFRGTYVDSTHRGVDDYWKEYEGMQGLSYFYHEDWIRYRLYMPETDYNFSMQEYIRLLIKSAEGVPVLQFNRIDFRLPWLKKIFPKAKIIHIYRDPRDQWCSTLQNIEEYPADGSRVFVDMFYFDAWCDDLVTVFPFLDKSIAVHPYQRFYLLWRLSYMFGVEYADFSLSMEELIDSPGDMLDRLFKILGDTESNLTNAKVAIRPVERGRWAEYASAEWFAEHEDYCESLLLSYFELL